MSITCSYPFKIGDVRFELEKPQSGQTLNSSTFPYVYNRNTPEQSNFYYFESFSDTLPLVHGNFKCPKPAIEERFVSSIL